MLITRVLTALVLIPLVLCALYLLPHSGWVAFAAIVTALGAWEWGGLCNLPRFGRIGLGVIVGALVFALAPGEFFVFHQPWVLPVLSVAAAFWLVVAPLWLRFRWSLQGTALKGTLPGILLLVAAGIALAALRAQADASGLLAIMVVAWVADTAAYFSGKAFGKHKLAPAISPGKTWEGVAGAMVAVGIYVLVMGHLVGISWWKMLLAGWCLTAVSIVGDLMESLFKRQAGIKDSSQLLPGHGGVLDRVDSLLALLPVAALAWPWLMQA
ncbi:phosphatidate cytidylyltransferase [Silvimonas amylolytica]|uniref:Phosphatidate cytidylyltransferase n=1 Tax=Silvimonas amylolytica TaxID=449663 RepID=A0ABQ2PG36_9NEIS|nr:phosphatidate cytidylyltransferase [Silvimonas amylolytica]GGP24500.1 phosphatidate cytidylyltransferase [Silvimonas amylolytica]